MTLAVGRHFVLIGFAITVLGCVGRPLEPPDVESADMVVDESCYLPCSLENPHGSCDAGFCRRRFCGNGPIILCSQEAKP